MARPNLGDAAKTVVGSIRMSKAEAAAMVSLGGDKNTGLRMLLDRHMSSGHRSAPPSQGRVEIRKRLDGD